MLSFPYRIRFLLAFDPALCSAVLGIFVRTILKWLSERAAAAGALGCNSGAVVLAQRFGGALNLYLHFHALVLDDVYASERPFAPPRFQPARELTDQDVVHVTGLLVRRIVRYLQRRGRLPREEHVELDEPAPDEPLLALISAASVEGRIELGP
ncbi:MAG: transposase [Planctomycetota bacterium]|nr:transposase [Planctomycetota bacterium]